MIRTRMANFRMYTTILVAGMLITGSLNTLTKKAQNQSSARGIFGENHKFNHPWFQTLLMFYGEAICLIVYEWQRRRARKELDNQIQDNEDNPTQSEPERVLTGIFVVPTICDLIGTTLSGIGLLYVPASVWQMLRGAIIIFAGILSVIFLKRKMYATNWIGMGVVMAGLATVGLSSVLSQGSSTDGVSHGEMLLGIVLILSAQLVSASQMIVEEIFIKKHNVQPIQVVGMEGCFGVLFMTLLVLPVCYFIPGNGPHGSYENSLDAISQMWNNPAILGFGLAYLFSIAFYNYFGLSVTKSLTAVHRTLIDACRTMLVWVIDLIIHYCILSSYGEAFDMTYGFVQIGGFALLMLGTLLYNEIIYIKCIASPRTTGFAEISADFEGSQPLLDGSLRAN
ncbi:solute carrier family 35 member F6-like [Bolinopsis microptera]|uniref:solute carrier family 35 member F6-like n=1 Tax=Bolinopsis microptera TaxID=2820187 RepID=UPI003079DF87